ncbi:hypothetical protein F4808DRAFT_388815 [Astrocystis sublimbata]|nr:hypothetical protein F4808DRAFT_388815 [Astrocystis sublimbata]
MVLSWTNSTLLLISCSMHLSPSGHSTDRPKVHVPDNKDTPGTPELGSLGRPVCLEVVRRVRATWRGRLAPRSGGNKGHRPQLNWRAGWSVTSHQMGGTHELLAYPPCPSSPYLRARCVFMAKRWIQYIATIETVTASIYRTNTLDKRLCCILSFSHDNLVVCKVLLHWQPTLEIRACCPSTRTRSRLSVGPAGVYRGGLVTTCNPSRITSTLP